MKFCEKLRALRKQHGLKQSDLAKASGLTTNKIQRYEQMNQMPRGEDALALARALHVVADYLLDDVLPFPPPEECLSEKVVIIRKLEGLLAAMTSRDGAAGETGGAAAARPDVIHLPVLKLGAGYVIEFDAVGLPSGDASGRDMYFDALGDGTHFAGELHGSSMQGLGGAGFARGEIVVFRKVESRDVASGDYVYVRTDDFGLFRQVFTHGETIRLRAMNPADPEIMIDRSEVRHIGRLVRRVRDY